MKWLKVLILPLLFILISSCATIFSGQEEDVTFTSDPPNVKVFKDTRYLGTTPLTITVQRVGMATANLNQFKFESDGYRNQEFTLTTSFNNVSLFNTSSITSWLTDFVTGAVTRYSPTDYHIILEKNNEVNASKFIKRTTAQQYILYYYNDIIEDAAKGKGTHIDNLTQILSINSDMQKDFILLVKQSSVTIKTPPEFIVDLDKNMKESSLFSEYSYL